MIKKYNEENAPLIETYYFNTESNTAKYLIENSAKINEANNSSETASFKVMEHIIIIDTVKYLIENGADVNRINKNGNLPLIYTCSGKSGLKVVIF